MYADTIECCEVNSNNIASTNPQLPPTGLLRNGICRASTGPQVVFPDDILKTCINKDDDCDGTKDDSPIDGGGTCGSSVGSCVPGTRVCNSVNTPACTGSDCFECVGPTTPVAETCNGGTMTATASPMARFPACPFFARATPAVRRAQLCMLRAALSDKVCALAACAR